MTLRWRWTADDAVLAAVAVAGVMLAAAVAAVLVGMVRREDHVVADCLVAAARCEPLDAACYRLSGDYPSARVAALVDDCRGGR